jgi:hypothetical protein
MSTRAGVLRLRQRAGVTLIELATTSLILVAVMGLVISVVGWVVGENRWVERRRAAETEVANVMERVTLLPWDRISIEAQRTLPLSPVTARILPEAQLAVTVQDAPGPLKRIRVELRWPDKSGRLGAPVRLTSWVARRLGESR